MGNILDYSGTTVGIVEYGTTSCEQDLKDINRYSSIKLLKHCIYFNIKCYFYHIKDFTYLQQKYQGPLVFQRL